MGKTWTQVGRKSKQNLDNSQTVGRSATAINKAATRLQITTILNSLDLLRAMNDRTRHSFPTIETKNRWLCTYCAGNSGQPGSLSTAAEVCWVSQATPV